jgi:hypothetical protein
LHSRLREQKTGPGWLGLELLAELAEVEPQLPTLLLIGRPHTVASRKCLATRPFGLPTNTSKICDPAGEHRLRARMRASKSSIANGFVT